MTDDGAELSRRGAACALSRHPRPGRRARGRRRPGGGRPRARRPRRGSTRAPGTSGRGAGCSALLREAAGAVRATGEPAHAARRPARERRRRPERPSTVVGCRRCPTRRSATSLDPRPRCLRRARARSARRSRTSGPTSPTSSDAWRTRLDGRRRRSGRREPVGPAVAAAIDRAIDEIGRIEDPHRAIDWLSTFPQVVLLAHRGSRREVPGRGPRRPRGRLRRDPGRPARRARGDAARRRDAGPARAGPRGHERRDDRCRTAGGRCSRRSSGRRADAAGARADRRRSSAASLAVADRGEQVRSQVRGALVEELTARLLARRVGRGGRPARAADPVRRRRARRSTRTTSPSSATARPRPTTASGARAGINADVLHQLDDARDARRRRGGAAVGRARRLRRRAIVRGPPGPPDRAAPTAPRSSPSRRSTPWPGRARDATATPDRCSVAVPRPLRRGRTGRPDPDVGPAPLRAGPRLASTRPSAGSTGPGTRERGLTWLVRAAEVAVVGARSPSARRAGRDDAGRRLATRLGPPPDRVPRRRRDARSRGSTSTGCCSTHAAPPTRIPAEFDGGVRGARRRPSRSARVELGPAPADAATRHVRGPAAGARPDGPRQQRGLRRLARRGGHRRGRRGGDPRASRDWSDWSTRSPPSGARPSGPRPGGARTAGRAGSRTPPGPSCCAHGWSPNEPRAPDPPE